MSDPRKFDILGSLLRGRERPTDETVAIEKMLRGQRGQPIFQERPERQPDSRLAKVKTTYYLGEEVYENLEDARQAIADMLPEETRHRVTRSLLVELAIRLVLRDFEKKGRESAICQWLFRGLARSGKRRETP
ncbi:MAG: hypothetical protein AB1413_11175 [Thermodesulfobacteriota bacterium]